MRKILPVHPFLFAMSPILFLYAYNLGQMGFSTAVPSIAVVLSFTVAMMIILGRILKDYIKAGIITSIFLVLCFSYGHIYDTVMYWRVGDIGLGRHRYLMPIWTTLLILGVYITIKWRGKLDKITEIFNITAGALIIISLVNISLYELRVVIHRHNPKYTIGDLKTDRVIPKKINTRPDIYYIILDQYARADILEERYNFDNSEFINFLLGKGFYIASGSYSNYSTTAHSLPSSLNMEYLDKMIRLTKGMSSIHWKAMYPLLQDYKLQRFLKANGYKYIHFGTLWEPTTANKYADRNVNLYLLPEFSLLVYRSTIIFPICIKLGIYDPNKEQWLRIRYQFDELAKIPDIKEPTFVFAHLFIPHGPCVFDKDGQFLTEEEGDKRTRRDNYINQVIYANKRVKEVIDKLLSDSEAPPIIVLQSDEGPYPPRYHIDHYNFEWKQATKGELREKLGILNAYYLPNVDKSVLYPSITPVNSFRIIFNLYFGENLPLLPDKSYTYLNERDIYTFIDVTDKIRH